MVVMTSGNLTVSMDYDVKWTAATKSFIHGLLIWPCSKCLKKDYNDVWDLSYNNVATFN